MEIYRQHRRMAPLSADEELGYVYILVAIDGRTTARHGGYRISLRKRWLVEKPFGWLKQTTGLKKSTCEV